MLLVDYGEALPAPAETEQPDFAAIFWGLHLAGDDQDTADGALIAFRDTALYQAVAALLTPDDLPGLGRALAQCERLAGPDGIASRLLRMLNETRLGK
jgi:hypothetical protein